MQLCLSVFKRFDYSLPSFEAVSEAAWHALIAGRHLWANGMQDEILQTWEEAGEGCVSWERRVAFLLERNHLFFQLEHHPRRAPWWLEEKASCSMPAAQSAAGNVAAPLRGNAEGRAWKTPCDFQISFKSLRLEKRKKWKFSLQLIWEAEVGRPLIRVFVPIALAPSLLFLLCQIPNVTSPEAASGGSGRGALRWPWTKGGLDVLRPGRSLPASSERDPEWYYQYTLLFMKTRLTLGGLIKCRTTHGIWILNKQWTTFF